MLESRQGQSQFSIPNFPFSIYKHSVLNSKDGKRGFIRSLSVLAFVAIGPRRGPTMLNRMCSEAELAVGMRAIISSSKRANVTLQFAPFGDGIDTYTLYT